MLWLGSEVSSIWVKQLVVWVVYWISNQKCPMFRQCLFMHKGDNQMGYLDLWIKTADSHIHGC